MENILIIKLGALGDFAMQSGRMHAIVERHPGANVAILTQPFLVPLAKATGLFNEYFTDTRKYDIKEWYKICKTILADRKWDMVYDMQYSSRTIGRYYKIARFLSKHPFNWAEATSDCFKIMHTPAKLPCLPVFARPTYSYVELPSYFPKVDNWHGENKFFNLLPEKFALLIPGCSAKNIQKRWPASRYREITTWLGEKGIKSVVMGTNAEAAEIEEIANDNPYAVNFMGKSSLLDVFDLARKAIVTIGNDTGPTHMARLAGDKVVQLFTDYDYARAAVQSPKVVNLKAKQITGITVDSVKTAIERLLKFA